MRINFRQGVASHQVGGFLQVSGSTVNILAADRPVTATLAHKTTNYTHSEDNSVTAAWVGPFTETNYWLYWDFNPLTFVRTFAHTTIQPIAQSVEPGNGNSPIIGVIPGDPSVGAFKVDGYFVLPINKTFAIVGSTGNNGNYTVKSISYNPSLGETTIYVNEAVVNIVADGTATLDIDSYGIALYTEGRHWFNTTTNVHSVLQSGVWVPVIRVFAAQLINATTLISVSQNSQSGVFTGTQIGNNESAVSGRVLIDESAKPILKDDSTFFTTEDQFFTNQSRVDAIRLESNVVRAQCLAATLAAFGVVAWTDDGKITAAQYNDVGSTVIGLLTENLSSLEVGAVIVQGSVTNPLWDWITGASPTPVGSSLWVDNGLLVTVDPHESDPVTYPIKHVPVARVLDKDTIIFEQGLGGVGPQGPIGSLSNFPVADTTDIGGVTLLTPSSDPLRGFVISDTDSRLTNARSPLSHTHNATDITVQPGGGVVSNNAQDAILELGVGKLSLSGGTMTGGLTLSGAPTAQGHATTKLYVDNLVNGLLWLEAIDVVNLISDTVTTPPVSPIKGDAYIIPAGATGIWAGITVGNLVHWVEGSPEWIDLGQISTIHQTEEYVRIGVAMRSTTTPSGTFLGKKNQIAEFHGDTGAFIGFEIPVENNAVYVESYASVYAFDQYAFDGTNWIRFGGSNQPIVGDGTTIDVIGGLIGVIPTTSGGQTDALYLSGNDLAALDLRWSAITHAHTASAIVNVPVGTISATNVQDAINELATEHGAGITDNTTGSVLTLSDTISTFSTSLIVTSSGSPTLPDLGPGTISAEGIYVNGVVEANVFTEKQLAASPTTSYVADFADGSIFELTMGGNTAISFSNIPASAKSITATFILKQDAIASPLTGGNRVPSFPASVKWDNGTVPTWGTAPGDEDIVTMFTYDGGTTWRANLTGQNYA